MMEDTYYQLEEALVQGFQTPEEYQTYKELKDKWATAKVEIEKNFPKEEDYQTKKTEYDVLAPLIETETDLDIIDQALRQFHEKGNEKQEQLSFELD